MQTDVPYKNGSRYRQHCKHNAYKINAFLFILPCLPSPFGPITDWVEFVLSLCTSLSVTPGLILMLNYFSFANDVARLQSARLNMYGGLRGESRFMEMQIRHCRFSSHSLLHYWWPCTQHIQARRLSVWVCCWLCVCACVNSNPSFSRPSFGHYIH